MVDGTTPAPTTPTAPPTLATPPTTVDAVAASILTDSQASFAALATVADSTNSYAVVEKDDKPWLEGYPFVITAVTLRDGSPRKVGKGKNDTEPTNYMSLECTLADAATRDKLGAAGKMTPGVYDKWEPNEHVIINDGSTGIYRQMCEYLERRGYITFPDGPANGGAGESRYDTYRDAWVIAGVPAAPTADDLTAVRIDGFALLVKRGLRASTYESELSPDEATTFYLA